MVDKYLVKTLVIFEVEDKGAESGKFDPANPQKAYIDGYTVVIPMVDNKKVDNIANVLADNGYTVTGLMGTTVIANKNGVTYFFSENPAGTYEYWTVKVNGETVEYVAKDGVSKLSNKDLYDKYNGNGTGFIWKSGSTAFAYAPYQNNAAALLMPASYKNTAMVYETGYVKLDANSVSNVAFENSATYAKVGSDVKVTVSNVEANTEVTLTYNTDKTAKGSNTTATTGNVVLTIPATENITLASVAKATTIALSYPDPASATPVRGLTVKFEGPASAKVGDKVTVTATISGKTDESDGKGTTLTLSSPSSAEWLGTGNVTNVTKGGSVLTAAKGADFGTATTVQFSYTVSDTSSNNTITVAIAAAAH